MNDDREETRISLISFNEYKSLLPTSITFDYTLRIDMNTWQVQTILALVSSTMATASHVYYPWGSMKALYLSSINLFCYSVVDSILGWEHYRKSDRIILVHHGGVAVFSLFLLYLKGRLADPYDIERITRWGMLSEVTSIFNNVRVLTRQTAIAGYTRAIFAVVFLVLRTAMTVGCYCALHRNRYFSIMAPFVYFISILNMHWCRLIVRKMLALRETPSSSSPPTELATAEKQKPRCQRTHFWEHYLLLGLPLYSVYTMQSLPSTEILPQILRHVHYGAGTLMAFGLCHAVRTRLMTHLLSHITGEAKKPRT